MKKTLISFLMLSSMSSGLMAGDLLDSFVRKWDTLKSDAPKINAVEQEPDYDNSWARPKRAVQVDNGYIDERLIDERRGRTIEKSDVDSASGTSRKNSKKLKSVKVAAVPESSGYSFRNNCANPVRVWDGADYLAKKNQLDKAYSAYLGLMESCTSARDLKGAAYHASISLSPELIDKFIQEPVLASPRMKEFKLYLVSQRLMQAAANKEADAVFYYSNEYRADLIGAKDINAVEAIAWSDYNNKDFKSAEKSFKAGLKIDNEKDSLREGLVLSYLSQKKTEMAWKEADKLGDDSSDYFKGSIRVAQAQKSLQDKQYKEALNYLDQAVKLGVDEDESIMEMKAWSLLGSGKPDRAANIFGALAEDYPNNTSYKKGLVEAMTASGDIKGLKKIAEENKAGTSDKAREAVAVHYIGQGRREEAAKWSNVASEGFESNVGVDVGIRHRSGKQGEAKLKEAVVPQFYGKYNVNDDTYLEGSVLKRSMSDSINSKTGTETIGRLTMTLSDKSVGSVALGAAATGNGTTAMYDVKYKKFGDRSVVEVGSSRRPITDSVRSYSGVNDSTAGFVGKVARTDIYARGSYALDSDLKASWSASMGRASGTKIDDNDFVEARGNILKSFTNPEWAWLSVGPEMAFSAWNRDQNQYTGKNGGYWSPESDVQVGLRGNAMTPEGGTDLFKATGFFGYADRTLFFGSASGAVFESDLQYSYLMSPYLIAKTGGTVRSSPGYSEYRAWVGLEIPFDKRTGLYASDLKDLQF